jgi:MFS family permease
MALTQGLFSAMIADAAPPALRGTAFGLYNLAGGVAMLIASAGFGTLWTVFGPPVAFLAGAGGRRNRAGRIVGSCRKPYPAAGRPCGRRFTAAAPA